MPARIRLMIAVLIATPLMSGCLVVAAVDTAAGVGGLAIDATGATIGAAGEVVEGTVDVIIPGDDDDEDGERDREER